MSAKTDIYKAVLCLLITGVFLLMPFYAYAQCTPPSDGLVGHWKLDETSGTFADSSGNGLTGTQSGGVVYASAGVLGVAAGFDGINDYIDLGNVLGFTGSFSISAWVYLDNPTASQDHFINKLGGGGARDWTFYNDFGGPAFIIAIDANNTNSLWGSAFSQQVWTHVAAVYDAGNRAMHIYQNGLLDVSDTSANVPGSIYASANGVRIGSRASTGAYYDGRLDDIRVYDRALSADEIAAIYSLRSTADATAGKLVYDTRHERMMYCNGTNWVHAGIGSYNPNAVFFDGSGDFLSEASLNGTDDSKLLTGSIWINTAQDATAVTGLGGTNNQRLMITRGANEKISIVGRNSGNTVILDMDTISTVNDGNWHHLLFSVDMSDSNKRHLYLDDVDDLAGAPSTHTDNEIDFGPTGFTVGGGSTQWDGGLAEYWVDFGTYIDLSVEANRRKFISDTGLPMYLGEDGSFPAGSQPEIFLSGDTITWHSNRGYGGGFTENGEITYSSSQPGDSKLGNLLGPSCAVSLSCTEGPYVEIDNIVPSGSIGSLYGDDNYIYAGEAGSVQAYTFDGTNLVTAGSSFSGGGTVTRGLHSDGTYLYMLSAYTGAGTTTTLYALTFNGSSFTSAGSIVISEPEARDVWSDGTYIYVGEQADGLAAYSFNGTTFNEVGRWNPTNYIGYVAGDGDYIYACEGHGDSTEDLNALSFNGTTFTLIDTYDVNIAANACHVEVGGSYIFVTEYEQADVIALTFDGSAFSFIDDHDVWTQTGEQAGTLWVEPGGNYVHVGSTTTGDLSAYSFDGSVFTYLDLEATTNTYHWVWGDENYIYSGNGSQIRAFSGFENCYCEPALQGTLIYDSNFNVMKYANGAEWVPMGPVGGSPVDTGLVAHYKLDETGDTNIASDSSVNTNTGTLTNYPADESAYWVDGKADGALDFEDSLDTHVVAGSDVSIDDIFSGGGSLAFWMKVESCCEASSARLISKATSNLGANGWNIRIQTFGEIWFRRDFATSVGEWHTLNNTGYQVGEWVHVALTYSEDSVNNDPIFYVNGKAIDGSNIDEQFTPAGAVNTDAASTLRIGESGGGGRQYDGLLDDVRLYDRMLAPGEVEQLYRFGLSGGLGDVSGSCANPARAEGVMLYNLDNNVLQYCNGENWIGIGQ
jgi:hypothetical protein